MNTDKSCPYCKKVAPHSWVKINPPFDGKRVYGYWCSLCWHLSTVVTVDGTKTIVDRTAMKPESYILANFGVRINVDQQERFAYRQWIEQKDTKQARKR